MTTSGDFRLSGRSAAVQNKAKRSWKGLGRELFDCVSSDDIFGRSAQLAYYFFFAIFPGFIFLSALLNAMSGSVLRETLMVHLPRVLPPHGFHLIKKTFTETTHGGAGSMTFGAVLWLWSATAGMAAVCDTLNAVHDVKEGRPYWKVQAIALGLTVVAMVLLLSALGTLFSADVLVNLSPGGAIATPLRMAIRVAAWIVAFLLVAALFALVYFFAPDVEERRWHWITPGAALGIGLWVVATVGLRVYLHFADGFSSIYGSLEAVIILLLWFYIGGFAILMGAEVNATLENQAAKEGDPEARAKGEKTAPEAG
jgi:membrane protein